MIQLLMAIQFALHQPEQQVDWILFNGIIYTVDSNFSVVEAMAIDDGKIVATGTSASILATYKGTELTDLQGKPVFPGFIDPHCHFLYYGIEQSYAQLYNTKSFAEVLQILTKHDASITGGWIIGRGWDQNDWPDSKFPDCKELDKLFPSTPVYLIRIDGHAALANTVALQQAGINAETKVPGGVVEVQGTHCTGILIDNAMLAIEKILPVNDPAFQKNALLLAQEKCFATGLTSVHDAGLDPWQINLIKTLQNDDLLRMRIYAMVNWSDSNYQYYFERGMQKTDYLNVRSFKCYADGALGSRGAALLQEYTDDPGNKGLLFASYDSLQSIAKKIYGTGFQMCTHAIGDAANRLVLDVYGSVLHAQNAYRWRIEHCQVVTPMDQVKFWKYSVIPSIQATHATSDMYWAEKRLGSERIQYAYAYKSLLSKNKILANGSDFPVEQVNPLLGFYAAISRKDLIGYPTEGFQVQEALNKSEALRAMTIWAAYAAFEDTEKGSLEKGKYADFVILDDDIMTMKTSAIPDVKVIMTVVDGEKVYVHTP
jgi:hypothetical protein